MSKKHGIGIIFKINKNETIYYRGEFAYNKLDGYGFSFSIVNNVNKSKYFRRGKFEKGNFIQGIQIKIEESNKMTHIEEYEGEFFKDMYHNQGKLHKKSYKINELEDKKLEMEYEYLYLGNFKNNKESGKGCSKKVFPNENTYYTYEGDFKDGMMHGEGFIEFSGDTLINSYRGIFENDNWFCKYGIVEFKSGDVYEGFFNNSNGKSKVGLYRHFDRKMNKTNEHYFGEFFQDKKHGLGRFIMKDNKLLVGVYNNGEKNGCFGLIGNTNADEINNIDAYKISFLSNVTMGSNSQPKNGNNSSQILFSKGAVKQNKTFYLFENDEVIDKSDKPFKD